MHNVSSIYTEINLVDYTAFRTFLRRIRNIVIVVWRASVQRLFKTYRSLHTASKLNWLTRDVNQK